MPFGDVVYILAVAFWSFTKEMANPGTFCRVFPPPGTWPIAINLVPVWCTPVNQNLGASEKLLALWLLNCCQQCCFNCTSRNKLCFRVSLLLLSCCKQHCSSWPKETSYVSGFKREALGKLPCPFQLLNVVPLIFQTLLLETAWLREGSSNIKSLQEIRIERKKPWSLSRDILQILLSHASL